MRPVVHASFMYSKVTEVGNANGSFTEGSKGFIAAIHIQKMGRTETSTNKINMACVRILTRCRLAAVCSLIFSPPLLFVCQFHENSGAYRNDHSQNHSKCRTISVIIHIKS